MKRIVTLSIFMVITLLFISCGKKDGAKSAEDAPVAEIGVSPAPAGTDKTGYSLRVNAAIYSLEADTGSESDKTKWLDSLNLGEKVTIGNERRVTFHGDGKVYSFTEVRRANGKEGLAWSNQVAAGGNLAVIIDEKANLFKTASSIDVTGQIISRKTIVVMFPETENGGFVEIRGYDPEAQANRQNFIRLSSVSTKDADIQSSIMLQTAAPLKNEGAEKNRKDSLLETAIKEYPSSVFYQEIAAMVNPSAPDVKVPLSEIKTVSASQTVMMANNDNVNVRDYPSQSAGKVVGKLSEGNIVSVSEQTADTTTIDGEASHWYHITEPIDGWVFGLYLGKYRQ